MTRLPLAGSFAIALSLLCVASCGDDGSSAPAPAAAPESAWPGYGRNPQHTALSPFAAQPLQQVRWSTPMDLQPQYDGNDLPIHYGSPLLTGHKTVIIPVKTGAGSRFQFEAHRTDSGQLLWTEPTDYTLPPHHWVPSVGAALNRENQLMMPAGGGTIMRRSLPDASTGPLQRLAFYGIDNYQADPATFNAKVFISTPITTDSQDNLYFGFFALTAAPLSLESGIARISSTGQGTWMAASVAAGDPAIKKVSYNSAPALSADGKRLYVAVDDQSRRNSFANGYLLALDSQTLTLISKVRLKDVLQPANDAILFDDATSSPTVGPDGDVYFGVLENPPNANHGRGWLLHFDASLAQTKIPGAFGWDDTASIVPASAVPLYTGKSSYLLLTKYNNYVEKFGDGVNRVAVLDPNASMVDPISTATVMQEVLTIAGPTPDEELRDAEHPNAVREWCINTAAVDPQTKSALINNEDGILYRWDFTTNTLSASVVLTPGIGEAYTPTLVGDDGTVYAINNATLFAVGQSR